MHLTHHDHKYFAALAEKGGEGNIHNHIMEKITTISMRGYEVKNISANTGKFQFFKLTLLVLQGGKIILKSNPLKVQILHKKGADLTQLKKEKIGADLAQKGADLTQNYLFLMIINSFWYIKSGFYSQIPFQKNFLRIFLSPNPSY